MGGMANLHGTFTHLATGPDCRPTRNLWNNKAEFIVLSSVTSIARADAIAFTFIFFVQEVENTSRSFIFPTVSLPMANRP